MQFVVFSIVLQWGLKTPPSLEHIFSPSFTTFFFLINLYNHNSASPFWNNSAFLSLLIFHFSKQNSCLLLLLSLKQIDYKCLSMLGKI